MSDRIFFSMAVLAAVMMVALALVWPQGLGKRSPAPFGHTPAYQAAAEAAKAGKAKPEKPAQAKLRGPL